MNYELAKKLKEAGYPLQEHIEITTRDSILLDGTMYDFPTLEELIEACGDDLWSLTKHANIWQTNFRDGMAGETAHEDIKIAVANLWLRRNEHE